MPGAGAAMRMLAIVALVGCNQVWRLDPTELVESIDSDGDGELDAEDNCPHDANPSQADEDDDSIGDVCDNCPVVANPPQELAGDNDEVGAFCDPHPASDGDCLVVFDSFGDPDGFAAHWQTISGEAAPVTMPSAGEVALVPTPGLGGIGLVARDEAGALLAGSYDVQVSARGMVAMGVGEVTAVSNMTSTTTGNRCGVRRLGTIEYYAVTGQAPSLDNTNSRYLTSTPVGDHMVLRLVSRLATGEPSLRCRVDYGLAVAATLTFAPVAELPAGGPGVLTLYDPIVVEAIAIYRYQPGTACPPPIIR